MISLSLRGPSLVIMIKWKQKLRAWEINQVDHWLSNSFMRLQRSRVWKRFNDYLEYGSWLGNSLCKFARAKLAIDVSHSNERIDLINVHADLFSHLFNEWTTCFWQVRGKQIVYLLIENLKVWNLYKELILHFLSSSWLVSKYYTS